MTQETKAELTHIQGHLDLVEQSIQMAYTQLKMAREKLAKMGLGPTKQEPLAGK